jgi:hypothetical protein
MAEGRSHQAATRLSDGRVFVVGGYWNDGDQSGALASAELFDPGTGSFAPAGSMGTPRGGPITTLLQDGRVLIAGGDDMNRRGTIAVSSAVVYEP